LTGSATTMVITATNGSSQKSPGFWRRCEMPRRARPSSSHAMAITGTTTPGCSTHAARYAMANPMVSGVSITCSTLSWQMNGWCHSQPFHIAVR
jgi:hypothetical protein